MNKILLKGLVATAVVSALTACGSDNDSTPNTCAEAGEACTKFTVVHTNDNHGRFWENSKGEYGMAARMTLIEQIRAEVEANGGDTILLSGGDINTGVPESDMQDAEPDFVGMNLLSYDAMAVGNHEFDNEIDVLEMQRKLADFPMLAANIYHRDEEGKPTDVRYFEPYKVFEVNGLNIAVIGMTTDDTPAKVNPNNVKDIFFAKPEDEIQKVIAEIKANEEVDVIFATTHMGHYVDATHGSNAPGDVTMARSIEKGELQAIFGGHSQEVVCMEGDELADFNPGDECKPDQQNGTYIMQAKEWGKYVGRADFEFFNGELHLANYALLPVNLKTKLKDENGETVKDANGNSVYVNIGDEIKPDPIVKELLRPYKETGQELLDVPISNTNGRLEGTKTIVRSQQTNLGHLLGHAYRSFELVDADFGVMNSGGIRESIDPEDGIITYRHVLEVQPFGNFVTKATMTGAEVKDYLDVVATITSGDGGYAHLENIKLTVDCDAGSVDIHDINGRGFNLKDTYSFSVISFSADGGDNYPKINVKNTERVDADVLRAFFVDNQDIDAASFEPVDGDLVYMSGGKALKACPAKAEDK